MGDGGVGRLLLHSENARLRQQCEELVRRNERLEMQLFSASRVVAAATS